MKVRVEQTLRATLDHRSVHGGTRGGEIVVSSAIA